VAADFVSVKIEQAMLEAFGGACVTKRLPVVFPKGR